MGQQSFNRLGCSQSDSNSPVPLAETYNTMNLDCGLCFYYVKFCLLFLCVITSSPVYMYILCLVCVCVCVCVCVHVRVRVRVRVRACVYGSNLDSELSIAMNKLNRYLHNTN